MNEHLIRGAQPPQSQATISEKVTAVDVDRGVKQSLDTGINNQYAMIFEATDENGKKTVSAYVKKAGRSLKLNEAATKKGGLLLLRSVCVRSSWEKPEQIKAMYEMLPDDLKRKFIESRGDDFRVFTSPAERAIYLFIVLFKSGEKWMGEGIAYPGNVKNSKLHVRLDELAETRAFNRCVGRGLADGFINADQVAGSEFGDDDEVEDEDEGAPKAVVPTGAVIIHSTPQQEADPAGSAPFRSPESIRTGGAGANSGDGAGSPASPAAETGPAEADGDEPFPASGQPSHQQDGGNSSPDEGRQIVDISVTQLIALAKLQGVMLKDLAREHCGTDVLRDLDPFQRSMLKDRLAAAK